MSQVYLCMEEGKEQANVSVSLETNPVFLGPKPESGAFTFKAASFWLATKGGS